MWAIEIKGLSKRYGRGRQVLKDLALEIEEREILAISGPSGCGKTTLLNCIGGLDRPDAGAINAWGLNLAALDDQALSGFRNRHIGFVFQTFQLHPLMTVLENIALPALLAEMSVRQARERAEAILAELGMSELRQQPPGTLSGGQMQRVAIARALVMEPQLILADEPTGNLDEETGGEILDLFARLNRQRGTTIVLVTHEQATRRIASRVLTMRDGRLDQAVSGGGEAGT